MILVTLFLQLDCSYEYRSSILKPDLHVLAAMAIHLICRVSSFYLSEWAPVFFFAAEAIEIRMQGAGLDGNAEIAKQTTRQALKEMWVNTSRKSW